MSAPEELASRVERATGADRLLGREVLLACKRGYVSPLYRWLDPTASLDAAMTLVPEGWQCENLNWWAEEGASCSLIGSTFDGECWIHRFNDGRVSGAAATPALALTAAALRARAHQQPASDGGV